MEDKNYKWKTRGSLWATIPIFIVLLMLPTYGVFAIERAQEGIRLEAINIVVEATLTDIMPIGGAVRQNLTALIFIILMWQRMEPCIKDTR